MLFIEREKFNEYFWLPRWTAGRIV